MHLVVRCDPPLQWLSPPHSLRQRCRSGFNPKTQCCPTASTHTPAGSTPMRASFFHTGPSAPGPRGDLSPHFRMPIKFDRNHSPRKFAPDNELASLLVRHELASRLPPSSRVCGPGPPHASASWYAPHAPRHRGSAALHRCRHPRPFVP